MMQCKICGGEMIQKSRLRLALVGALLIATVAIGAFVPYFWVAGAIFALLGLYFIVWATRGQGYWCRSCKRFNIS